MPSRCGRANATNPSTASSGRTRAGTVGEIQDGGRPRTLVVPVSGGPSDLGKALLAMERAGIELHDIGLRRPTMDDVFLTLTGHHAEESANLTEESDVAEVVSR